jgi:sugar phosphate permease
MIGSSTGAAIAPLIVIPIASAYGWRVPFFVNGLIGVVWVLVCFLWFKNEPAEMKHMSNKEKSFIERTRCFEKHDKKFPWKIAFRNQTLWALLIALFCSQWALYFFIAWMPVYLQEGRHLSENEMKVATSYLFIVGIMGGLSAGFFSDWLVKKKGLKFGRRLVGMLALGMMSLLFVVTAVMQNNSIAAGCLICCYFFMPICGITVFSTCIDIGKGKVGTVAGIMNFFGSMGAFSLAILFGKIVDVTHNFNAPLFVIAGVLFTGSCMWFIIDPTTKLAPSENINKVILQYQ